MTQAKQNETPSSPRWPFARIRRSLPERRAIHTYCARDKHALSSSLPRGFRFAATRGRLEKPARASRESFDDIRVGRRRLHSKSRGCRTLLISRSTCGRSKGRMRAVRW